MTDRPSYRLPEHIRPLRYDVFFRPDFATATFEGEVVVDLEVAEPSSDIILNGAELEITSARLQSSGGTGTQLQPSYRSEDEQIAFAVPGGLQPGHCRLEMQFSGKLSDLLRGLYRSKFRDKDGTERWIAVTQFESTDARRAFPCWDEPEFKATFSVTVEADEDLVVLSNAREASSERLANGVRRTRFAETAKLPTYLVAVAIGPFVVTTPKDVGGVPLRVASVPGRAGLTTYALSAAEHALGFLCGYFSMPYPFDKLDHVAIPDFAAGAMENAGLVTYRETALLVGEESSQLERQRVAATVAHETAHMWFGNLVTMRWWEGTWLNEAFASFMELLTVDDLEPAWEVWTNFGVDRAAALATDSLHASRSIEYPVGPPEEAEDMFDTITYDKGASVLRMIERHLGPETFRKGLKLYLERHAFSNTETTDLWDALEEASGKPVRRTMGTWVNQVGHPVISVEREGEQGLRFSQRRFLLDGSDGDGDGDGDGPLWSIPLSFRWAGAAGRPASGGTLMEPKELSITLPERPDWVVINESGWGVYRAHYSDDLRRALLDNLDKLDGRERLSFVADTWAAAVAGLSPVEHSLELWSRLTNETDPEVWWGISNGLGLVDLLSDQSVRTQVQALARDLAGGVFARVGWGPREGREEAPRDPRLRARLVTLLGTVGADEDVRAQAGRLLRESIQNKEKLPPDLATAVAQAVAFSGGEEEWQLLHKRFKEASTPQDEVRYLHALGGFADVGLTKRALEMAFSDEVRSQDAPHMVMGVLSRRDGCALAWEAIEQHWSHVLQRWPNNAMPRMLEAMPALAAAGDQMATHVENWLGTHPVPRGELRVRQSLERLQINLAFKHRLATALPAALEATAIRPGGRPGSPSQEA